MSYNDEEKPRSPFRSRGFIFGAIVLGLLAAAAIVAVVVGLATPKEPVAEPTAVPSESAQPAGEASVCGLDDVEMSGSVKEAPATEWEFVGRVAVPTSTADAGPGVIEDDGFRYCYARTPEGALFAASNMFGLTVDGTHLERVASDLIVPGPGRDALMESAAGGPSSSTGRSMDIAGFRMLSYDGTSASIDLAISASTGELLSFVYDVEWSDGDWKAVTTDTGQQQNPPVMIDSLGSYTPWSGGL